MKSFYNAEKISEHVYWVGATDWNVRDFHGYKTQRGTTYNAFLVIDEKITLIDTVKSGFASEMLERISSIIPPEKIDYIVSNHSEPDHSGSLPEVIAAVKPEKVFASSFGAKTLNAYYDLDTEVRFRDTYWEDQGYGTNADNPRMLARPVFEVRERDMKDGKTAVVIC